MKSYTFMEGKRAPEAHAYAHRFLVVVWKTAIKRLVKANKYNYQETQNKRTSSRCHNSCKFTHWRPFSICTPVDQRIDGIAASRKGKVFFCLSLRGRGRG